MLSILNDWYPGDQALDFLLIVVLGVALLSTAAWAVARGLRREPAARHLVLVSALFCCLAMPPLAALVAASGRALVSIPLLRAEPDLTDREPARGVTELAPVSWNRNPALDRARAAMAGEPVGSHRPAPGDRESSAPSRRPPRRESACRSSTLRAVDAGGSAANVRSLTDAGAESVWSCGSAVFLIRFAVGCLRIRRIRHSSSLLRGDPVRHLLEEVSRGLGARRTPQVLVSRLVTTPLAVGFSRPSVVLPERLIGVASEDEIRDVLVHEVAHIVRRDHLVVLLQELAGILYWPIVPVHGLIRELGRAREELCDNHVLQDRDAVSYGETLLHMAELSMRARPLRAAVGILHWRGELEQRIAGFLDQRRSTRTRTSRWLTATVALMCLTAACDRLGDAAARLGRETRSTAPDRLTARDRIRARARRPAATDDAGPGPGARRPAHGRGRIHRSVWTRKPGARGNLDVVTDEAGEVTLDVPETLYIWRLWARPRATCPSSPTGRKPRTRSRISPRSSPSASIAGPPSAAPSATPTASRSRACRSR